MNTQQINVQQTVDFVVAPAQEVTFCYPAPIGPAPSPTHGVLENTYYVARPNRLVANHDSNDLGRAATLILQLLPLISENAQVCMQQQIKDLPMLLPTEVAQLTQLLLQAAYMLETANATPARLCKVDFMPNIPAPRIPAQLENNPFTGYFTR